MGFWSWFFGEKQPTRRQFPNWVSRKKDFSILLWTNFADIKNENSLARILVLQDESTTSDRSVGSSYESLAKALIVKDHLSSGCSKWAFFADNDGLGFYFDDPVKGPVFLNAKVVLTSEQTYHLGVVRSGNVFTFYVDGREIGSAVNSLEIPEVNAGPTNAYYTGKIGAPHFFVFAVTPAEIFSIAHDGKMPGYPLPLFLWDGSPAFIITQKQPLAFWNDRFSGLYACVSREKGIYGLIPPDPESIDSYFERGNSHLAKGEFDKAIANFSEVIRLDPKNEFAYCNRGSLYGRLGELDKSIADLTEAIKLNPKQAIAYFGLGHSHVEKGELDKALADYTRAIKLDSKLESVFSVLAIAFANRAISYDEKGDNDKALADYDQSIKLDPRNAVTISNRGCLHARNREYGKAIADHTEAIRLAPKDAANYFNRSLADKQIKKDDRASADYNQAVRLDPQIDQQLR